jgi:hypothetical protein
MIIKDEIGEQVKYSLKAAKLAQSNASLGGYSSSASMLSLTYTQYTLFYLRVGESNKKLRFCVP